MHELALGQSIVDLVVDCARRKKVYAVTRIVVEVGAAAGVDADALAFCFDVVAAGTLAEGAELVIAKIRLGAECRCCTCRFEPKSLASACPDCGSHRLWILSGRELRVKSFDIP